MTSAGRRHRTIILVVLGGAAIVLLVAVATVPLGGRPGGSPIIVGGSPLLGKPAPAIELADLSGDQVSLAELAGRPVVVHFWASWCVPCREEFPLLVDALDAHRATGLAILGVVHDDEAAPARRFADDHGATWRLLADPGDTVYDAYRVPGVPLTAFIDRDGIVRAVSYGVLTQASLDAQLSTILPRPSPTPDPTATSAG